jgi:hypothetical protein
MDAQALGIVSHRGPQQLAGELSAPAERLWSELGNIWRVPALAPGEKQAPRQTANRPSSARRAICRGDCAWTGAAAFNPYRQFSTATLAGGSASPDRGSAVSAESD